MANFLVMPRLQSFAFEEDNMFRPGIGKVFLKWPEIGIFIWPEVPLSPAGRRQYLDRFKNLFQNFDEQETDVGLVQISFLRDG